jgi:radical SAM-linked protein
LFRFSKEGEARFLSHHDLMRLFERALRRAALPVRMTQGFNPHPKLSILSALPLGMEASNEALETEFDPPVAPADVLARLGSQLPGGIRLHGAELLPPGARIRVESVVYEAELPAEGGPWPAQAERFLARRSVPVERVGPSGPRTLDVRPAVEAMSIEKGRLSLRVRVAEGGTPKAAEVFAAAFGCQASAPLRRVAVNLAIVSPPGKG